MEEQDYPRHLFCDYVCQFGKELYAIHNEGSEILTLDENRPCDNSLSLNKQECSALIPILQRFVDTGSIEEKKVK